MNEIKPAAQPGKSRRKLLAAIGILSLFPIWKAGLFAKKKGIISCAPPEKKETMRVLSQDGQLVEVDISKIKILQNKISNQELQEWIKKQ